jgi:hypothetical protein
LAVYLVVMMVDYLGVTMVALLAVWKVVYSEYN